MAETRFEHSRDAYNILKLLAAFFALYGMIFKVNEGVGKYINTKIIRAKFVRSLFFIENESHSHDNKDHNHVFSNN